MLIKLYWKIRDSIEENYFMRKYSKLPPKIYYDKRHNVYVNPKLLNERSFIEYVCGEITETCCIYHFHLGKTKTHVHTIAEVLLSAYNESESFSIDPEDEQEYSKQELEMIIKLIKQGKIDSQC